MWFCKSWCCKSLCCVAVEMFSSSTCFLHHQVVLPVSCIVSQYSTGVRAASSSSSPPSSSRHRHVTTAAATTSAATTNTSGNSLSEVLQCLGEEEVARIVTPALLQHVALLGTAPAHHHKHDPFRRHHNRHHTSATSAIAATVQTHQRPSTSWRESHISANSFLENKHRGPITSVTAAAASAQVQASHRELQRHLRPLIRATRRMLLSPTSSYLSPSSLSAISSLSASCGLLPSITLVPVRGFKTQQSIERESLRQTSFTDRLRDGLRARQRTPPSHKTLQAEAENNPKLKGLLTESGSEQGQRMIKVAFAEGYLAADPQRQQSRAMRWIRNFQQVLAIVVFIAILFSLMGGMGGSMFRMHVGNGNEVHPEEITVSFEDVKGVEEAKQELQEIVEFLRNPDKFTSLGAELPKGVLLVGPPGTGKTLLARAVAGEAGVPFFHAAGPEFDEILVGQGARRVRDLFRAAKMRAPCVIFIDEIDSVGAKRSNSVLHPYANQTINQLLSEMDGFHKNEGVIVLGATNRRDDLDKALLRPGRFDVEVQVPIPDLAGRKEIFEYYLGKVKMGDDVDKNVLSRGTTGFTGADIKNVTNQAALRAAADQVDAVSMKHLEAARDKVLMGPERKSRIPDEEANLVTAYHEGGHTLVAYYTRDSHPLHKVTIIPRGPSLGHTAYIPAKEQYHMTRSQMLATMDSLMGGRAAEEIIFGSDLVTSGASSDLKQATNIATHMVKDLGMSDKVGLRTFEDNSGQLISTGDSLGQSTKENIDFEIKRLLQDSYDRAKNILKSHAREHKALAEALMKYETLDADDIKAILDGRSVSKDL